jgi:hypothetical protein
MLASAQLMSMQVIYKSKLRIVDRENERIIGAAGKN